MYNFIECNNNYSKISECLWQYYRDDPKNNLAHSALFKSKLKITGKTHDDDNTKRVEIAVPLKYLSNFCRTLEISFTICQINLTLTYSSSTCVITNSEDGESFATTDTKLFI